LRRGGGLDRRLLQRAPKGSPRVARGLDLLGRSAGGMKLWFALAAALGLSGGRFRRRAALRGLFGAGLASAFANGPVKMVVRRRRPKASRLPWVHEPATSSFPSGHAAAGFAFAVGAGQEVPALAVPLVGVAAMVGYSRVHSGAHFPGEVAAGAVIGAGAGVLTRRLWPVAPHEPAQVRTAPKSSDVEPSAQGGGLVIVINPSAGSSGRVAEDLREELPEAEVVELEEGDDLEAPLKDAAGRGCAVGVAGGDGTINTGASIAADSGKPLFVIPGGTLNHFAYALGLETIADSARAVRQGRVVSVDRGLLAGHTFVNTASIGSYVELVDAREKLEKRIGKWPAVIVALWGVLRHSQPVDLELDGERRKVWMIFIGNCRYLPAGFTPSWRERLDDGQLDIRIVDGTNPYSRTRLLLSVMTGRLGSCGAYEQRFVPSIHVKSLEGPLRLARDGETFDGPEEFTIAKADEPLVVYVPGPEGENG
jgi:diacylglycerol kinase family enzyme/membrane-associated phospholipid phosphatase